MRIMNAYGQQILLDIVINSNTHYLSHMLLDLNTSHFQTVRIIHTPDTRHLQQNEAIFSTSFALGLS